VKVLKLQTPDKTAFEEAHATFRVHGDLIKVEQVDLIGKGFFDFIPGHGLYVDMAGSSIPWMGKIKTKAEIPTVGGHNYSLTYKLAGNQRIDLPGFKVRVLLVGLVDTIIQLDDWRQDGRRTVLAIGLLRPGYSRITRAVVVIFAVANLLVTISFGSRAGVIAIAIAFYVLFPFLKGRNLSGPIVLLGVYVFSIIAASIADLRISVAASAAAGVLRPILSSGVSIVNARAAAVARGIDIVESRSSRSRHFTSLVSIKLTTDAGDRWVEGTVFEPNSPRLVSVRGVAVEAPLGGTMLIIANDDQPGVIGEVGTILGRHRVNIANFALGRGETGAIGAIGVVNVDQEDRPDAPASLDAAVAELRRVPAVREAWIVRLPN
jgi:hypothetical protein